MRRFFLIVGALILGLKFGIDYLTSESFQKYGDQSKAPWTCQADVYLGNFYYLLDDQVRAIDFYNRTIIRCPKTEMAEAAEFNIADSLDQMEKVPQALDGYNKFMEIHPQSIRVKAAQKAISRIRSTRSL